MSDQRVKDGVKSYKIELAPNFRTPKASLQNFSTLVKGGMGNRTDVFKVAFQKSANAKTGFITDLVNIRGKWLVVFAWDESPDRGFRFPSRSVEIEEGELKEYDDPDADCWCTVPMNPKDILKLPSKEPEKDCSQEDLPPEWRFEIPTEHDRES